MPLNTPKFYFLLQIFLSQHTKKMIPIFKKTCVFSKTCVFFKVYFLRLWLKQSVLFAQQPNIRACCLNAFKLNKRRHTKQNLTSISMFGMNFLPHSISKFVVFGHRNALSFWILSDRKTFRLFVYLTVHIHNHLKLFILSQMSKKMKPKMVEFYTTMLENKLLKLVKFLFFNFLRGLKVLTKTSGESTCAE